MCGKKANLGTHRGGPGLWEGRIAGTQESMTAPQHRQTWPLILPVGWFHESGTMEEMPWGHWLMGFRRQLLLWQSLPLL